jgi:hypothetical protein
MIEIFKSLSSTGKPMRQVWAKLYEFAVSFSTLMNIACYMHLVRMAKLLKNTLILLQLICFYLQTLDHTHTGGNLK